ncbi:MAG TPA: protein kinase [Terriglobales bacterium]|jgi:serine/threonine protein kinase|nr:protein kinase [Terriglobales bacterium]
MSDPASKRLGDYEILAVLGSGGMGRVYKVRNVITDRVEAMKVLLPDLQGHEEVAARFLREIKVLAALKHPNIAALLTALTIENQLVMIMEYVEGQSLSSRLSQGPIPVGEALKYIDQVLDALNYAHQQHVIHRDIKPANIMLTPEGMVKLMDFGIARSGAEPRKLTATGSTLGSLSYMSPEQVKGEATDERSDLYSLGISLYEMVTGEKPFHGDSDFSIMAAQINESPKPPMNLQPALPKLVNDIILKSIAKTPEQRFPSADAFRQAVKLARRNLQDEITLVRGSQEVPASAVAAAHSQQDAVTTVRGSQATTLSRPAAARTTPAVPAMNQTQPSTPPPAPADQPMFPPQPAAAGTSQRGFYMALGALLVIIVLVAAGLYLPRWKKASAAGAQDSGNQPPATTTSSPPVTTSPQQQPAASDNQFASPGPGEVNNATGNAEPVGTQKKPLARNAGSAPGSGGAAGSQAPPDTAELDAVEHEIDQLSSRAAAVNSSLDNMQRQQQASGYGLRGDIVSKQASMQSNLAKAQEAIEHNDVARAKRYSAMTDADVEALEKFLGR